MGHGFWQDDIEAPDRLRAEVTALQARLETARTVPVGTATGQADAVLAPDSSQAAMVWPWLAQRLQAHGLQLQSLRPGALEGVPDLPVQTVALEVQGRWADWLAFERQMHHHAPWWRVTQWQVTPAGAAGQVKMLWHWRWAWRAPQAPPASPAVLPVWSVASAEAEPGVFDDPKAQARPVPSLVSESALPPDPRRWPVQSLRLLGVWQQSGVAHAVLGSGLHHVVAVPGQRVGQEGHRVQAVGDSEVVLRPGHARAPDVHLGFPGGSR